MALSGKYVGTLNLGDERDFYSGLSKAVGYPQPNLRPAMEREHVRMLDSDIEFTTSNYEITTTSAIEWKFSASPESPPAGGFPKEQKILKAQARAV